MTKACYRSNPAVRQRAIDRSREYVANADAARRRRIYWSKRVYALRQYIENHLEKIAGLEKRLLSATARLEKAKAAVNKAPRGIAKC